MSNKYLKLAQRLKKGQSRIASLRVEASPFGYWDLLPYSETDSHPSEFDANGSYLSGSLEAVDKARKDKKKKPEILPAVYTTAWSFKKWLFVQISYTVVKKVA